MEGQGRARSQDIIERLGLEALPGEGGWFRRSWASPTELEPGRPAGSAIYFLLTSGSDGFSALHRLESDEVYHFYAGDPVELHRIDQEGKDHPVRLGQDILGGEEVQAVVAAGILQGSCLVPGGEWALLGTTMAPAFVSREFSLPSRAELLRLYPSLEELILGLTRV